MVDIVTNHMGYYGCGNCVDYSVFNPFNSVRVSLQFLYDNFSALPRVQNILIASAIILPPLLSHQLH